MLHSLTTLEEVGALFFFFYEGQFQSPQIKGDQLGEAEGRTAGLCPESPLSEDGPLEALGTSSKEGILFHGEQAFGDG